MLDVSRDNAVSFKSAALDILRKEILRVGASADEVKSALAFVASEASLDPRAYDSLPPRMRRLVDLVAVAPESLSASIFEML